MSVKSYDFTPPTADADNWSVAQRMVTAFAPQAQAAPDMTVFLNKGSLLVNGALIEVAPHSVGPFAPTASVRADRIVVDRATGATSIVMGTDGSPLPSALPSGKLPIARVIVTSGMTEISNAALTDERVFTDQASAGATLNANLTALSSLDASAGLLEQTGAATFAKRALGATNASDVPTRADADARYLQLSGGSLSGPLSLAGVPAVASHAANKQYVDQKAADAASVSVTGAGVLTGGGDLTADRVITAADVAQNTVLGRTAAGVGAPSALSAPMVGVVTAADAAAARSVLALGDAAVRTVGAASAADLPSRADADARYLQLSGGTVTGAVTLAGDPTAALHAASKQYVDNVAAGLDVKASVKAASVGDLALSGEQNVDGVAVAAGDRVLVKNQTTTAQNGVYVVAAGAWSRATDLNAWSQLPGAFVFVEQGATNADTGWVCAADMGGALGSSAVTWSQFAGVGAYAALSRQIIAGAGLVGGGDLTADRTLGLADTAVTPGSYGSANRVASFSVDQKGRLTAAGETAITPAGVGAAAASVSVTGSGVLTGGGDLTADRVITAADVAQNTVLGRTAVGTGAPSAVSAPMVGVITAADAASARSALGVSIGSDVQAHDADLDALAGVSSTGLLARAGAGAAATRSVQGSGVVSVANGDGVSGDPTVSLAMTSNRLLGRSAAGDGAAEQITLGAGLSLSGGELSATATGAQISQSGPTYLTSGGSTTVTGKSVLAAYEQVAGQTFSLTYNTESDYAQQDPANGTDLTSGAFALHNADGGGAADSYTKLLIHADGANGSTEIIDQRGITPFGTHCAYFDGTARYDVPQSHKVAFGASQDFTIETWARRSVSAQMCLFDMRTSNSMNPMMDVVTNGAVRAIAGAVVVNSAAGFTNDVWHHVAWSRSSGTSRIFLNGTLLFSFADANAYVAGKTTIGDEGGGGSKWMGWMDEFRVSKTARYTANFTPHTAPHVRDADTVYLFHFDDGHGAQALRDDSRSGHEVSFTSTASLSTSGAKFGTSCFDANTGGAFVGYSKPNSAFAIGAEDFTVDMWVYPRAATGTVFNQGQNEMGPTLGILISGGNFVLYVSDNGTNYNLANATVIAPANLNVWQHVAMTRNGSNLYVFIDGVLKNTVNVSTNTVWWTPSTPYFSVGRYFSGGESNLKIDEVRVKRGVAEWTSNFTPPTAPYVADDRTVLLLHFDGANGDKVTLDSSESSYGTAQISASAIPALTFGSTAVLSSAQTRGGHGTSLHLDNTANGKADFDIAANDLVAGNPFRLGETYFCVEGWFYDSGSTDGAALFDFGDVSGASKLSFRRASSTSVKAVTYDGSSDVDLTAGTITAGAFNHFAMVKEPRGWVFYVNGVATASASNATLSLTYTVANAHRLRIGCSRTDGSNYAGYCDSFRITNGKPRYTANFTPGNLTQDDDTTLLWEFNGAVGQKWVKELSKNTAIIAATNARTVSDGMGLIACSSDASISTAAAKFGASSIKINSILGRVAIPNSTNLDPGSSNFVLDFWFKDDGSENGATMINRQPDPGYSALWITAAGGILRASGSTSGSAWDFSNKSMGTFSNSQFDHFALVRSGDSWATYKNGVQITTWTLSGALMAGSGAMVIGSHSGALNAPRFYLDEIRLSIGTDRGWTGSTITVPTAPYGSSYTAGPYWVATKPGASALDLSAFSSIDSATLSATVPPGTSLKFLISTDGYGSALKRWNGAAWISSGYSMTWDGSALTTAATASQLDSVANTAAELQTGLTTLNAAVLSSLNVVAVLATSNPSYTPSLDNLTVGMDEYALLKPVTDYTVSRKKASGEQSLTVTRVKSGAANHVIDVV